MKPAPSQSQPQQPSSPETISSTCSNESILTTRRNPLPPPITGVILASSSSRHDGGVRSQKCDDSSWARIVSATVGSTITALAVTPLEVVKVRQQSNITIPRPAAAAESSATASATTAGSRRMPFTAANTITPCSKGCGTFVLSTGLGEYLMPRSTCKYFDPQTGNLTRQAKEIATETNGTFKTLRKIYIQEGLGGIYAGLAPTLVMGIPNTVMYFYLYDELIERLRRHYGGRPYDVDRPTSRPTSVTSENLGFLPAIAGASARSVASLSTAPLELLRTRQAARAGAVDDPTSFKNGSMVSEFRTMIRQDGFASLFRGVGPTLMRDVPFSAIYWVSIESMRDFWKQRRQFNDESYGKPSTWEQFGQAMINGSVSGMVAAAATTPLDVVKTRMQVVATPKEMTAEVVSSMPNDTALVCEVCNHGGGSQAFQVKSGMEGVGGHGTFELETGMTVKVERVQQPQSAIQIAKTIVADEGVTGLWRGNTARMMKVAPAAAIMISSYEIGKRLLLEE